VKPLLSRTSRLGLALLSLIALSGVLYWEAGRLRNQAAHLSADMASVDRARAEALATAARDREQLLQALTRKQAQNDRKIHLVVHRDSAYVALVRNGVRLRVMKAEVGAGRRVGVPPDTFLVTPPRGMQVVARRLGSKDRYEPPRWVWADRSLPVPGDLGGTGWLGDNSVVTASGTLVYAQPTEGPFADSSYVMPGAFRVAARDLAAIRESLAAGTRVYFY
jgi:hypothetical protein